MIKVVYILIFITSVFLSSVSQILLKKSSQKTYKSKIREYLNWQVILGYFIMLICTILTILAYHGITLSMGATLEAFGYVFVTIFGVAIFKEKLNVSKIFGLILIIVGAVLFALF